MATFPYVRKFLLSLLTLSIFSCVTSPSKELPSKSGPNEGLAPQVRKEVAKTGQSQSQWEGLERERAFDLIIEETRREGGVTYDVAHLKKFDIGDSAFAVSLSGGVQIPATTPALEFQEALEEMLRKHEEDFWSRGYMLGTWVDQQAGILAIDRTLIFTFTDDTRDKVLLQAMNRAKSEGQKAIFDLSIGETISVP